MKYGPQDLARHQYVADRANSVVNRVRQVVTAIRAKDGSAVDDAGPGQVKIHEDCVTIRQSHGNLSMDIQNPPPDFLTSDNEACLSNGKLPIRISGEERVAGFKTFEANLTCSGDGVDKATAIGDELLKPSGFAGPMTYSYGHDRAGREVLSIDIGGFKQTAVMSGDGKTIAQFEEK